MSDHTDWLLKAQERVPMLRKTLLFVYLTKMGIAWAAAFFALLFLACYEIPNIPVSYIFLAAGGIVGGIFLVLMIFSMGGEVKEVKLLRDLHHGFITSLADDPGNCWNPKTIEKFENFEDLFKRICPEASINVPSWTTEKPIAVAPPVPQITRPKVIDNAADRVPKYLVVGNQYFHIPNVKTFTRLGEIFGFDWPDCIPMSSDTIKQTFTEGQGKQLPDISEFDKTK
jgi:hypothetical protein